jgi:hypothetical protein
MSDMGKAAPLADKTNFYKNAPKETKSSQPKNYATIGQSVSSKMQDRHNFSTQAQKEFFKNSKDSSGFSSALQY